MVAGLNECAMAGLSRRGSPSGKNARRASPTWHTRSSRFDGQQLQSVHDHKPDGVCVADLNDGFNVCLEIDCADRAEVFAAWEWDGLIDHDGFAVSS